MNLTTDTEKSFMKIHFPILILFIFLTGCSSVYTVKDYPSKEEFYKDFSKSVRYKSVKVILVNDSSFTIADKLKIVSDTLLYPLRILRGEKRFPIEEVKNVSYLNYSNHSGIVKLKNGSDFYGENIKILSDSTFLFIAYSDVVEHRSLKTIKEISYKNRIIETFVGAIVGVPLGFAGGFVAGAILDKENDGLSSFFYVFGAPIGIVLGSIIGALMGYSYIFIFNP